MTNTQERGSIQKYFEDVGFKSLSAIYGEAECDGFRAAVRKGHSEMIGTILNWLGAPDTAGMGSVLDAGCGTGALSIPLAASGVPVDAVDFSHNMIKAARENAACAGIPASRLRLAVEDFMSISRSYESVVCVDVLARYSTWAAKDVLRHLSTIATSRLILTYTPKRLFDRLWLTIGNGYARYKGSARLYTHREADLTAALAHLGWMIHRRVEIASGLRSYFCCLVECRRAELEAEPESIFTEVWY